MNGSNIILIGMPGAGKSTLGVLLAKAMNYRFLDTDLCIQEREGKLLREIIAEQGQEAFLKIEEEVNFGINTERTVIAPGGSAIYSEKAMKHFSSIGTVIYLFVSVEELTNRLGDLKQRGVVLREGETLLDLYQERKPYYEKYAEIMVDVSCNEIGSILDEIKNRRDEKMEEQKLCSTKEE